ncbi:MAG: DUF58 domain-containing protein [Nocardioides sp.]|nr:DUF58 domain-containing protein [Nocardioides sp.]
MREALASLTTRGRAFLAAGVTAVVCAVVLGQPALTRVGVLLVALPLATAVLLGRTRYRLSLVRSVQPGLVRAGQPARVSVTVSNEGRTRSGVLLMEDHVPYVLGSRPRFVVDGAGPGWRREISYQVRSDVRGRHDIGPMTVRIGDAFGLVELGRAFRTTSRLVVTPRTVTLPDVPLGGGSSGAGENRPRAAATGSAEDVTVREYRRGDDLRRVHWPSSARVGELMVRREEQPWEARASVLLDHRLVSHRGDAAAGSLEDAVSAAASVVEHLARRGFALRLVTTDGTTVETARRRQGTVGDPSALLEALAVVAADHSPSLHGPGVLEHTGGGITVAVLGDVTDADLGTWRRVAGRSSLALAVVLDVDAWTGSGTPGDEPSDEARLRAGRLEHAGWRAAVLTPGGGLADVWRELGRARTRTGRAS